MTNVRKPVCEARVDYYDAAWGGWRALDTYEDAPTSVLPTRRAHEVAKTLSAMRVSELRVVEFLSEDKPERITRYRAGRKLGR